MTPIPRGVLWTRLRVAAMTAIAGFTIASATQTGCSSAPPPNETEGRSLEPIARKASARSHACAPGLVSQEIKGRLFCCDEHSPLRSCIEAGAIHAGERCLAPHQLRATTYVEAELDTCVVETCDLNRIAVDFPAYQAEYHGVLECRHEPGLGLIWDWATPPTNHVVNRACEMTSYAQCSSYGYYGSYGFDDGYGGYVTNGYDGYDGYGYGGYGGYDVRVREIVPIESNCFDQREGLHDCVVGDL